MNLRNLIITSILLTGLLANGSGQTAQESKAVLQDPSLNQFVNSQLPPSDAMPTCVVSPPIFASWFKAGNVSPNGFVQPADSVNFGRNLGIPLAAGRTPINPHYNTPNCVFYQWAQQMFLWLTSPAPASYGVGGAIGGVAGPRVFASPAFFDVSAPDSNHQRTLIPHSSGEISTLRVRAAQFGPNGLPVVFEKTGRMLEVEPPQLSKNGKHLVLDRSGTLIEVEQLTLVNGKAVFKDKAGKVIQSAKPALARQLNSSLTVQKFTIGGNPVFLNSLGQVVDIEQSQSLDHAVLEAQNGSLVYYTTMVNDVYAYFVSGAKTANHGFTVLPTHFPGSQSDLDNVIKFAIGHGVTFPDPEAMAVEVKMSWVEAAGLPNPGSYITINARIPKYDKSNPRLWIPIGQQWAQLALVGVHIVGGVAGHPEMIWSTFEHIGNTPLGTYSYIDTGGQTKTVPRNSAGTWLFSASNASSFNQLPLMVLAGNQVQAIASSPISPGDTIRWKAWGAASDVAPNPQDSSAASNTRIISLNNSVHAQLANGDLRSKYFMTGATWTPNGAVPVGGNAVGTSWLANATMETYQQGNGPTQSGTNCFTCHHGSMLGTVNSHGEGAGLSHIYWQLQSLFP